MDGRAGRTAVVRMNMRREVCKHVIDGVVLGRLLSAHCTVDLRIPTGIRSTFHSQTKLSALMSYEFVWTLISNTTQTCTDGAMHFFHFSPIAHQSSLISIIGSFRCSLHLDNLIIISLNYFLALVLVLVLVFALLYPALLLTNF